MKDFIQWLEENKSSDLDEGWKDWAKKAGMAGAIGAATAGSLAPSSSGPPSSMQPPQAAAQAQQPDYLNPFSDEWNPKSHPGYDSLASDLQNNRPEPGSPEMLKLRFDNHTIKPMSDEEWSSMASKYPGVSPYGQVPDPSQPGSWINPKQRMRMA